MCRDEDPQMRYGGMLATGLAYAGTGRRSAVRRLLHAAVSDVSNDVRRISVCALGFVMCRQPGNVPKLVALLAESFNADVRYGAAMAVGIACAGTASREAIALVEPLIDDDVDFVRQGAMIAMALVLQQEAEERTPKVKEFREKLFHVIEGRQFTSMAKFGAIIAVGILDAGGRNEVVSLTYVRWERGEN
jgi:26S proteasome regulatory subunit N2